ncbi:T9SS type A sorting domain-containing protein [Polaribacter sp.]|nr:T9SS type A sorting domain-containing protein [Polaribacter sp.]
MKNFIFLITLLTAPVLFAQNITITSGSLTLNSNAAMTVTGNFTKNGGAVNMKSGSSLIVSGSSSGEITYNRTLATDNWYLVTSPVAGETMEDLIANNPFATGTGSNIGVAPYANDGTAWNYQTTAATGSLVSGTGYSVKLASTGDIAFTGTIPVTDVGIAITTNTNGFNLIGNPYPSYVPVNSNADGTHNVLKINDTDSDFLTEATLWLWNEATTTYDEINHASEALFLAPGQGFFVNSNGSNTFSFTEAMQSHQTTDQFQRPVVRPEINLKLTQGTNTSDTDIFYIAGTTEGWDNGYDSTIFGGIANNFAIYTHLVYDSEGQDLGIQSLPNTNFENRIIPVGVNAAVGTTITISAETQNLPEDVEVYLEDREVGSFTLLETDEKYTITLSEALNGIGRFYLYTSAQVLLVDAEAMDAISVYTFNKNQLKVVGVHHGAAKVTVYNMLGKQIYTTPFQGNGANEFSLPIVATAVYLIELETANGTLNKKVIIE